MRPRYVKTKWVVDLRSGQAARRPRLDDVAAEVGVSPATVSLVLRGIAGPSALTRERVLAAAARLGYRPDRAASVLASRRSRLIGVMIDIGNPFHTQLVEDVHDAAERYGYNLVLSTITRSHDETRAIETLLDSRCEALMLFGPETSSAELADLARQRPLVVVGRPVEASGVDVVRTDDTEGLARAVNFLVELGHRHIAHVDGGRGAVPTLRRRAYRHAMRRRDLANEVAVLAGGETEAAGAEAARAFLATQPHATGVLAFNDRCAIGFLDTLVRAGVDVPGQVSLVGYDDSPMSRLPYIDLTTISQNTPELTDHAMRALLERLDEERTARREVIIAPRFVQRGTTGPPPTSGHRREASDPR